MDTHCNTPAGPEAPKSLEEVLEEKLSGRPYASLFSPRFGEASLHKTTVRGADGKECTYSTAEFNLKTEDPPGIPKVYRVFVKVEKQNGLSQVRWWDDSKKEHKYPPETPPFNIDPWIVLENAIPCKNLPGSCPYKIEGVDAIRTRIEELLLKKNKTTSKLCDQIYTRHGIMSIDKLADDPGCPGDNYSIGLPLLRTRFTVMLGYKTPIMGQKGEFAIPIPEHEQKHLYEALETAAIAEIAFDKELAKEPAPADPKTEPQLPAVPSPGAQSPAVSSSGVRGWFKKTFGI